MMNDHFKEFREDETAKRFAMCDNKSVAYTQGTGERLHNFEEIAKTLGVEREHVLAVYMSKHWLALMHWIRTREEPSDGIQSTIHDVQNYLDLLLAMAWEWREQINRELLSNQQRDDLIGTMPM